MVIPTCIIELQMPWSLHFGMKRVLVIEDDAALGWLLEKILSKKYEAITVSNGMEAWSWLSDGNIPDLIVTDIRMPLVDGIELLENLSMSGLFKNIPVIVVSGVDDPIIRQKSLDYGALAYLVKPFEPQRLLREIEHPFVSKMFL